MVTMFRSRPQRQPRTRPKPLFRGNSWDRGYAEGWKPFSANYRQRNPFCAACFQKGRLRFCDVVDHKLPIAHGGALLDPDNVWSLCHYHHNGLKAQLEAIAIKTGRLDMLVGWCNDPASRPSRLRDSKPPAEA